MLRVLKQWQHDIINLLYPNLCEACSNELVGDEQNICVSCWTKMPETKFHLSVNNPMEQKFWGRVEVEYGAAMYYFNKSALMQNVLHALKYRNNTDIGIELGRRFANELDGCGWLKDIDSIFPIPLAQAKLRKRGYNQSEYIAKGFASVTKLEVDTTILVRQKNTETQTKKSRIERLQNMEGAFVVNNKTAVEGKHILLFDDVVTTGATMEACALVLKEIPNVKVSIASLAFAID